MLKIGDQVRFLSEVGCGRVSGFQGKDIVLVEDQDGFEIPMTIHDVVLVGDDDYSSGHMVESKRKDEGKGKKHKNTDPTPNPSPTMGGEGLRNRMRHARGVGDEEGADYDPAERPVTFKKPAEERKGGDNLSVYLAFVPIDILEMTKTRFETYLVNDCNYYIQYAYLVAEGNGWTVKATGEVEPNTKLFVEEFGREVLNDMERVTVQLTAYKREKPFLLKEPVQVQLRIDPVKFYKLHTFQENDFFEQKALVYPIVENDRPARSLVVDAKKLKEEMYHSGLQETPTERAADRSYVRRYENGKKGNPFVPKHHRGEEPVVVDLHANELLDTTRGMSAGDILNYQLDVFRRTLADYAGNKGQKIVFIHGKGEGVLRHAIIHELTYRYKSYTYQDASFQEYGYGATQVTIR